MATNVRPPTNQISSFIYTVTCASFVPIVYFFFPETSVRSLEEIDAIFVESKSIFDCVRIARRMPKTHLAELGVDDKVHSTEHAEMRQA